MWRWSVALLLCWLAAACGPVVPPPADSRTADTRASGVEASRREMAERQFEFARDYRQLGDIGLAVDAARQTLDLWPEHAGARALIAEVSPQATAAAQAQNPTAAPRAPASPTSISATSAPMGGPATAGRLGSRESPVPVGQAYRFNKDGRVYELQVIDVVRNATATVKATNSFSPDPPPGEEYILVKGRLVCVSGPPDPPFRTPGGEHRIYAGNRLWGAPGFGVVTPEPRLAGQDIFPGATVEGWFSPKHLAADVMAQAVLEFDGIVSVQPPCASGG